MLGALRGEPCLSSCGIIASAPYMSLNGVKPVPWDSIVFSPQSTSSNWSAHLPFLSLSSLFLMAVKIFPFVRSTTPLDRGWLTEVKPTLVPMETQKSRNSWLSNCFSLSTIISEGTPKAIDYVLLEKFLDNL
jgi:hypothetical protein